MAEPETLAGGCIDSSIKIIGSQEPEFWKQELYMSAKCGRESWGHPQKTSSLIYLMSGIGCIC